MRRRPKLSDRPEVAKHLHDHIIVTQAELDAFTYETEDVRLLILAELRSRAADQETSLVLTLEAAAIAILAIMLSRIPVDAAVGASPGGGWLGVIILGIAYASLAVVAVALIAPSMWRAVKGNRDHARAVVWLAAYEEALTDRRRTPRPRWWRPSSTRAEPPKVRSRG